MARKTAADFDPELLVLFNAYVHGAIDRRGFLDKARKYAVGGITAAMLLDQLSPNFAEAQQVPPDDKRLKTERVSYPSPIRQREDERLSGAAGQRDGEAAGRSRGPREPRAEPAHRGHRSPARARQLHDLRARRAGGRRRLPGH